jgi:ubiquitin carboxyl-terminal hydrolase 4/11/15
LIDVACCRCVQGRLAESYAQLIKELWGHGAQQYSAVCPAEIKVRVGAKAPQFQGYEQQDSQELMNFLIDGLHEDLNRVRSKPVVAAVEGNGRPDDLVARLSWDAFRMRNNSFIVDVFAGLLRSHVKCNVCERESVTFDPYFSIPAPLPVRTERQYVVRGAAVCAVAMLERIVLCCWRSVAVVVGIVCEGIAVAAADVVLVVLLVRGAHTRYGS